MKPPTFLDEEKNSNTSLPKEQTTQSSQNIQTKSSTEKEKIDKTLPVSAEDELTNEERKILESAYDSQEDMPQEQHTPPTKAKKQKNFPSMTHFGLESTPSSPSKQTKMLSPKKNQINKDQSKQQNVKEKAADWFEKLRALTTTGSSFFGSEPEKPLESSNLKKKVSRTENAADVDKEFWMPDEVKQNINPVSTNNQKLEYEQQIGMSNLL